jgi:beta-phosphoglucomutase-like phosphatase (HAD superfamily)
MTGLAGTRRKPRRAAAGHGERAGRRLPCRAVAFDMDGLLLDTEPLWFTAERLTAAWLGWQYTRRDHAQLIGIDLRTTAEYLRASAPAKVRAAATVEAVEGRLMAELKYQARHYGPKARPGAYALLAGCAGAGLRTALVTSSDRQFMYAVLGQAAMRFGAYVDAQSVNAPKPAPDPYLAAVRALSDLAVRAGDPPVGAGEVIAVEDSVTGAASAAGAGCTVVAVPSAGQQFSEADGCVVVRSLDGLEAGAAALTILPRYLP